MAIPIIAFFNNKGGVGKTSLVYHLSWMYADLGMRVLAADLDPQANLSSAFLNDDELENIWTDIGERPTIYGCIQPQIKGTGDILTPKLQIIDEKISLIAGDLMLSSYEDLLSENWPKCLDTQTKERATRIISSFSRLIQQGIEQSDANLALVDMGPNLGAINRAALIASDHVVIPLAPDLYSIQGLRNLGPTLKVWRREWEKRLHENKDSALTLPQGRMSPVGYIVMQHSEKLSEPVRAYQKWINRVPAEYRINMLDSTGNDSQLDNDPYRLALLKHYRSLMPMSQSARKPIFHLKPADGAIGAHVSLVREAEKDFRNLATKILDKINSISSSDSQLSFIEGP